MRRSRMIPRRYGHGRSDYLIEGSGYIDTQIRFSSVSDAPPSLAKGAHDRPRPPEHRAFRFCRMFPDLKGFEPTDAGLIVLGQAMEDTSNNPIGDSNVPAGYTYFGQFVDHGITFDQTEGLPDGELEPEEIINGRSPTLDLDGLYGRGPNRSPELYEADGVHLRVGLTTETGNFGVQGVLPNDVPRRPDDGSDTAKQAILGDPRNDENLLTAQTHVAFLKFHNKVVDRLTGADRFHEASNIVRQVYHSIVLHDFLPRIVDHAVYQDVLQNGRKFYMPEGIPQGELPCMPVEFSVAAYRLGHSMIRNQYEFNRIFRSIGPGPASSLELVFEFSQVSGDLFGNPTLPTEWIIDWTRFYDFSGIPGIDNSPRSNKARLLDTRLATGLAHLPEFAGNVPEPHLASLAVRNLLRGRLLGLPTGQDVAHAIGTRPLNPRQVRSGEHAAILESNNFQRETPLWYYILKEAQVHHDGQRLGEVGSRIVVETLHGLIEGSRSSILREQSWRPSLPCANPDHFTMPDLLAFVDDVNPLGNEPLGN